MPERDPPLFGARFALQGRRSHGALVNDKLLIQNDFLRSRRATKRLGTQGANRPLDHRSKGKSGVAGTAAPKER